MVIGMRLPRYSLRALFAFMTLMCVAYAFPELVVLACGTLVLLTATLIALGIMIVTVIVPVWIALDAIKSYREKES